MNAYATETEAGSVSFAKWLTCLMFFLFAMTTDAVGSVIPKIIQQFGLSMKAAGAFHYVPMGAIALGALFLGFLADRLGRKATIVIGLILYATGSGLFAFGSAFFFFVGLLAVSGLGISVFKIGALALIGDISGSTRDHTSLMNTVEGFFGIGSIVGPAIVAILIGHGLSWKWLYVTAAVVCCLLIAIATTVRYPHTRRVDAGPVDLHQTFRLMTNAFALGFSFMVALYVAVEVAIYVWMPTYLQGYHGPMIWLSSYALTIFFILRATGRFLGAFALRHMSWTGMLAVFGFAIFACFAGSLIGGARAALFLLPLSGLFMSTIYPTLNSKGISCFHKSHHGAIAGVILFFTAAAAALGPLLMAVVSDAFGDARYGFGVATAFALLLCTGLTINWLVDPAKSRLRELDRVDYALPEGEADRLSLGRYRA
jgi:fucose permease